MRFCTVVFFRFLLLEIFDLGTANHSESSKAEFDASLSPPSFDNPGKELFIPASRVPTPARESWGAIGGKKKWDDHGLFIICRWSVDKAYAADRMDASMIKIYWRAGRERRVGVAWMVDMVVEG